PAGARIAERCRLAKHHQYCMIGPEGGSQSNFHRIERLWEVACFQQVKRRLVDLARERIVGAGNLEQLFQLALEFQIPLPQHGYLPLDQRNCRAGGMRQAQSAEERSMTLEEIGVSLQVGMHVGFRQYILGEFGFSLRAHGSWLPSCAIVTIVLSSPGDWPVRRLFPFVCSPSELIMSDAHARHSTNATCEWTFSVRDGSLHKRITLQTTKSINAFRGNNAAHHGHERQGRLRQEHSCDEHRFLLRG